jgi:hypothetical protein
MEDEINFISYWLNITSASYKDEVQYVCIVKKTWYMAEDKTFFSILNI